MGGVRRLDLLPHALAAAARFPIIPLRPGSKTPAVDAWPRRATQDRRIVRRWWTARSDRNIGVCTGPHLLVVDLDVADHGTGRATGEAVIATGVDELRRLAREHGDRELWGIGGCPRTYTVETPSSGWHLYFRTEDPTCCRNTQQLLGPRIDTRGTGGFVVAAGSVGAGGRPYRAVVHRPIAPAPDWLVAALRPPAPPPAAPRPRVQLTGATAVHRYVQRAVRDECAAVAAAAPGGRNATLLRASRILGEFVGAGALSEDDATAALRDAAAGQVGIEAFTEREAARTIRSGLGYGRRRPRDLPTVNTHGSPHLGSS